MSHGIQRQAQQQLVLVTSFIFCGMLVHLSNEECIKMRKLALEGTGPCHLNNTFRGHVYVVLTPSNLSLRTSTFRFKNTVSQWSWGEMLLCNQTGKMCVHFESSQQSEIIILDQTEETMCLHRSKPVGHIAKHTAGCRSNRCWAQASDLD